jgi:prepilin-type N-terminal cleavage/methylation domain-containing protein
MKTNEKTTALARNGGMTMVELIMTTMILGIVLIVVNSVFFSSHDMYTKTNERAGMQMDSRLGLSIMSQELRHAGCDPAEIGVQGVVRAAADTVRIRSDLDGDGVIETTEPSEDVTYFYDSSVQALFRDPGTGGAEIIVANVSNFTIAYLDASNNVLSPLPLDATKTAQVRAFALTIKTERPKSGEIELATTIALRNR